MDFEKQFSEIKNRSELPTHEECTEQVEAGTADALELFIWRYEPGKTAKGSGLFGEREFRIELAKLLAKSDGRYNSFVTREEKRYSDES